MSAAQPSLSCSKQPSIQTLYREHHGWLHGWLRRKLGDAHHAADLAQDTFVRILTACRAQELALDALREPRAYLTTVAGRVLLNHYRRLSLEQAWLAALAAQPAAFAASPEERLSILQTLNEIDALLDALPPRTRTVFLLAQLEGLSYAQIAERMDIALRTVKRHMAQAFEECLIQMA
ncbi:RNA polymerase sigma factor [Pseudorhodoferax aquiterrae]|uniref:RNA polymerase sigma factor n=1 Tax=Pseudorhodoferax aquiterrae TaxID=747304 RepID=A0ABQ3G8L2_9BURK|nr:sigma-70 family RNA polymerase sigma factor [Pseudorhodoferax aquiterrae]GHC97388.1 RNA polymerase sigma factor [Pseudorhodoferax aquiterrae]